MKIKERKANKLAFKKDFFYDSNTFIHCPDVPNSYKQRVPDAGKLLCSKQK